MVPNQPPPDVQIAFFRNHVAVNPGRHEHHLYRPGRAAVLRHPYRFVAEYHGDQIVRGIRRIEPFRHQPVDAGRPDALQTENTPATKRLRRIDIDDDVPVGCVGQPRSDARRGRHGDAVRARRLAAVESPACRQPPFRKSPVQVKHVVLPARNDKDTCLRVGFRDLGNQPINIHVCRIVADQPALFAAYELQHAVVRVETAGLGLAGSRHGAGTNALQFNLVAGRFQRDLDPRFQAGVRFCDRNAMQLVGPGQR